MTSGVFQGIGNVSEFLGHFLGGFEVELIGLELHALFIQHGLAGLDAEQDFMGPGIATPQVMAVVGGHQRQPQFPPEADEPVVDDGLLRNAVGLELQVEIAVAEDLRVLQGRFAGGLFLATQQGEAISPLRQADRAMRPSRCCRRSSLSMRGL